MTFALKDYREVPERIAEWYERHEEGRIVCEVIENGDKRVTVKASVYRTMNPEEPPAGVGHSALGIPGKTTFTKDSELENAETSAAGRALVMAGIPAKSVASEGEVRSKSQTVEPGSTVTGSPEASGMAARDSEKAPADSEGVGADGEAAPTPTPDEEDQRKDFRAYLAQRYGTDQALLMARQLFQTQARKVPNMTKLSLDELQAIDVEFKSREAAVNA